MAPTSFTHTSPVVRRRKSRVSGGGLAVGVHVGRQPQRCGPGPDAALERVQPPLGPRPPVGPEVAGEHRTAAPGALLAGDPVEARCQGGVGAGGLGGEVRLVPGRVQADPGVALAEQPEVAPELFGGREDLGAAVGAEEADERLDALLARGREPAVLYGQSRPPRATSSKGTVTRTRLMPVAAKRGSVMLVGTLSARPISGPRPPSAARRVSAHGPRWRGLRGGEGPHAAPPGAWPVWWVWAAALRRKRAARRPRRRRASRPRGRPGLRSGGSWSTRAACADAQRRRPSREARRAPGPAFGRYSPADAQLPPDHLRVPDERARLGAHEGHARVAGLRRSRRPGRRRPDPVQHLLHPREGGHAGWRGTWARPSGSRPRSPTE